MPFFFLRPACSPTCLPASLLLTSSIRTFGTPFAHILFPALDSSYWGALVITSGLPRVRPLPLARAELSTQKVARQRGCVVPDEVSIRPLRPTGPLGPPRLDNLIAFGPPGPPGTPSTPSQPLFVWLFFGPVCLFGCLATLCCVVFLTTPPPLVRPSQPASHPPPPGSEFPRAAESSLRRRRPFSAHPLDDEVTRGASLLAPCPLAVKAALSSNTTNERRQVQSALLASHRFDRQHVVGGLCRLTHPHGLKRDGWLRKRHRPSSFQNPTHLGYRSSCHSHLSLACH